MEVEFREFGGEVPIRLSCNLRTSDMPAAEAAVLHRLVSESGFASLQDIRLPGHGHRHMSIRIVGDGLDHAVSFDTAAAPARVLPLVSFLRSKARDPLDDSPTRPT
jgi:hypothetical protein